MIIITGKMCDDNSTKSGRGKIEVYYWLVPIFYHYQWGNNIVNHKVTNKNKVTAHDTTREIICNFKIYLIYPKKIEIGKYKWYK